MKEPTIYDYIVSLLKKNTKIEFPRLRTEDMYRGSYKQELPEHDVKKQMQLIFGCILSIIAQFFLEPSIRLIPASIIGYALALLLVCRSIQIKKPYSKNTGEKNQSFDLLFPYLILSIGSQIISFFLFANNRFTWVNLMFWLLGIIGIVLTLHSRESRQKRPINFPAKWFTILCGIVVLVTLFFRIYQINEVPAEMYSDHAEKLLDVMDIIAGKYSIFFERNTGREPIQFYVTALITRIFGTGFSFLSLKIGTVTFGLLTLPFVYLIGKQLGNKWIGLAALFFSGIAYWPNVISRVALRYSLYPLFTGPALYFLFRGLANNNVNDLVWSGLFVGFGLLGYSSFRIIPVYVAIIVVTHALIQGQKRIINYSLKRIFIIGTVAFSVFMPLLRVWFDNPVLFSYRSMSRLMPIENPFMEHPLLIFTKNAIDSILMPFWNNGHIWVHSVPNRPALDFISAAFYFIGIIAIVKEIINRKNKIGLYLLIAIPILMLPSILSLAYPGENPSLNRSAGVYVPIFCLTGYGFFMFSQTIWALFTKKKHRFSAIISIALVCSLAAYNNYQIVFKDYNTQFIQKAWNTSEIGQVIGGFLNDTHGESRSAYVIPYPHWVDTRLVGFNAHCPGCDFALWKEDVELHRLEPGEKIFIYKPEDSEARRILNQTFPEGNSTLYSSETTGKDFFIYTVMND